MSVDQGSRAVLEGRDPDRPLGDRLAALTDQQAERVIIAWATKRSMYCTNTHGGGGEISNHPHALLDVGTPDSDGRYYALFVCAKCGQRSLTVMIVDQGSTRQDPMRDQGIIVLRGAWNTMGEAIKVARLMEPFMLPLPESTD
jgi:hypothetical protein